MTDGSEANIEVEIEAADWTERLPAAEGVARRAAEAALAGVERGVVILLTDDETVRELNGRFRGLDAPTNVLAFPTPAHAASLGGGPTDAGLGDIALAFGVCAREARTQGKTLSDHLSHLVIHGVLHLRGHDHHDEDEAEVMEALEREILNRLGVADPYAAAPEPTAEGGAPHHV